MLSSFYGTSAVVPLSFSFLNESHFHVYARVVNKLADHNHFS